MHQDILDSIKKINALDTRHIEADFCFDKDLALFKGHFPGQPMLPGVMQIEMVRVMLEMTRKMPFIISHIKKIKYLKPIFPGDHIKIAMELSEKNDIMEISAIIFVEEDKAGTLKMILSPVQNKGFFP